MQQVRDWVHEGSLPDDASYSVPDLSEEGSKPDSTEQLRISDEKEE